MLPAQSTRTYRSRADLHGLPRLSTRRWLRWRLPLFLMGSGLCRSSGFCTAVMGTSVLHQRLVRVLPRVVGAGGGSGQLARNRDVSQSLVVMRDAQQTGDYGDAMPSHYGRGGGATSVLLVVRQVGGCLLVAWQRCWSVAVKSIQHMFPANCRTVLHSQSYIFGVICSCSF